MGPSARHIPLFHSFSHTILTSPHGTGGEREIGSIFEADGGPEVAQQRVESYLLGRGVNDTQSWGMSHSILPVISFCIHKLLRNLHRPPGSWTQLGNTWRALADPYKAVQCFRKALSLKGSDDPDVLLNLALVVQHSGWFLSLSVLCLCHMQTHSL